MAEQKRASDSLDRQRSRAVYSSFQRDQRVQDKAARQAIRSRERFAKGTFGAAGRSMSGTVGSIGAVAGSALGIAGGFAAAGAIRSQMDERAAASRLANQAGDPSLKANLLHEAQGVRGFTGGEALKGMEEFVTKTGDLDTARQLIGSLGELSLATGSDIGDLGATAGSAFNVLKDQIADPVERLKELNALMRTLAQQGSLGAVEIRDLAGDFGKLGAATRAFEGGAPELLRSMGAFAQIAVARGGAEGSADASTAAARLASDIVEPAKRKRFKALGVDIKSEKDPTKLRDPLSIMLDVLDKTGGDIEKTSGLFGIESSKIFKGLSATYGEAEKRKKGSGRGAVQAEFDRFAGAKLTEADVSSRAASRLSDPDLQVKETLKQFNDAIGSRLLPVLTNLIPKFAELIPAMASATEMVAAFVTALAENPLAGIGAIIATKIAVDIAAADLKNVIAGSIAGPLGTFGKLGLAAGVLTAAFLVAQAHIDGKFAEGERKVEIAADAGDAVRDQARKEIDSTGSISPETRDKLLKLQATETKTIAAGNKAIDEGTLDKAGRAYEQYMPSWMGGGGEENLDQGATLIKAGSNEHYRTGASETNALLAFDKSEAGRMQIEAAKALTEAAAALKGAQLNRGNAPSAVKTGSST